MFGKGIKLFTILGFEIRLDWSWLILAVLITWSLADSLFPVWYKGFTTATYWWMGVAGTIGLFFSVVFHELAHSLMARTRGIPMKGITLFIFGGVAEMYDEPQTPKSEVLMAIVGPGMSILIGVILIAVYYAASGSLEGTPVGGVIAYLGYINLLLAAFNLIPAFPMDGGRVLRAILWAAKKNLMSATLLASKIGSGFGILLIVLGVLEFIFGNIIGGIWIALIGLFIRGASHGSYEQLLIRNALEGEKAERFMKRDPITVSSDLPIGNLVEDYLYKYHYKMFPVKDGDMLVGCVTVNDVKKIPREERDGHRVSEILDRCTPENSIAIDTDASKILTLMRQNNKSRLMVVENGRLVGVVTLKDMLEYLSMKLDLDRAQ